MKTDVKHTEFVQTGPNTFDLVLGDDEVGSVLKNMTEQEATTLIERFLNDLRDKQRQENG